MPVIAMTQEMGSLGKDVAMHLAQSMNLQVMRHEVVDHIAEQMDKPKSAIRRVRQGKASFVERFTIDQRDLAIYTAEEVCELAERGNIILRGWGATCILRPVPHVACIRITRSFAKRVEWLMANLGSNDPEFAEAEIRRSDMAHSSRIQQLYGVKWGDPMLYDLVLNMDRLSVESAAEQIRVLVSRPEFQETPQSMEKLKSLTLEAEIRAALRHHPATHNTSVTIEASGQGEIILDGVVLSEKERKEVEKLAAAVPGVQRIDNRLRPMKTSKLFPSAKE